MKIFSYLSAELLHSIQVQVDYRTSHPSRFLSSSSFGIKFSHGMRMIQDYSQQERPRGGEKKSKDPLLEMIHKYWILIFSCDYEHPKNADLHYYGKK